MQAVCGRFRKTGTGTFCITGCVIGILFTITRNCSILILNIVLYNELCIINILCAYFKLTIAQMSDMRCHYFCVYTSIKNVDRLKTGSSIIHMHNKLASTNHSNISVDIGVNGNALTTAPQRCRCF
ncbi:Hypothetical_protein [Hexamita inflata]|uniref:Hypothetical_protein n=1 Tax=Hexamita inflata TaxID=28002 RepID=A0AA86PJH6_9EUKA|nr:Hypothetical protein HINF_LOCUS25973 [Hexamita inflata]